MNETLIHSHLHDIGDATASRIWGLRFARKVEAETSHARRKFARSPHMLDCAQHLRPRAVWLECIVEEIGKLSRTSNKLSIASDPKVRRQWTEEGRHRLLTSISLLRRMAEQWDRLAGPAGEIPDPAKSGGLGDHNIW